MTPILSKLLASMKVKEKVLFFVQPAWVKNYDQKFVDRYSIDIERVTFVEIELKSLEKVEDLYGDRSVFYT